MEIWRQSLIFGTAHRGNLLTLAFLLVVCPQILSRWLSLYWGSTATQAILTTRGDLPSNPESAQSLFSSIIELASSTFFQIGLVSGISFFICIFVWLTVVSSCFHGRAAGADDFRWASRRFLGVTIAFGVTGLLFGLVHPILAFLGLALASLFPVLMCDRDQGAWRSMGQALTLRYLPPIHRRLQTILGILSSTASVVLIGQLGVVAIEPLRRLHEFGDVLDPILTSGGELVLPPWNLWAAETLEAVLLGAIFIMGPAISVKLYQFLTSPSPISEV